MGEVVERPELPCADAQERSPDAPLSGGRERPILFSAPMVRALLDGRKTQTRRIVKPRPLSVGTSPLISFNHGVAEYSFGLADQDARGLKWWRCPYGVPGDRLWVRESYRLGKVYDGTRASHLRQGDSLIWYAADSSSDRGDGVIGVGKLRPGIFMPRWASRLTLKVEDVRVERLQDISEADAIAEGCPGKLGPNPDFPDEWDPSPAEEYQALWNAINGDGSWDANPWVWAVSFRLLTPDQSVGRESDDAAPERTNTPGSAPNG